MTEFPGVNFRVITTVYLRVELIVYRGVEIQKKPADIIRVIDRDKDLDKDLEKEREKKKFQRLSPLSPV